MSVTATGHYPPRKLKNGAEVLLEKPYSEHADEAFLTMALAKFNGQYVTWMLNSQDGGAYYGNYYGDDFQGALTNFNRRGVASAATGY